MSVPPIYVVSGGMGTSGEQLVKTALAQFERRDDEVIVVPHVYFPEQLETIVKQALANNGIIAHTLVNEALRSAMSDLTQQYNVAAIDLIGPLLLHLSRLFGEIPRGQPGLYRRLHEEQFKVMDAINFAIQHDDGRKPDELDQAEIILTGVSRAGKTPLSMYLATRGWMVANVPLIQGLEPPPQLFEIDPRRVVGLVIEPGQLIMYRRARHEGLGAPGHSAYTDPDAVYEEIEYARALYRRGQFAVVDTTDRPIEESADEIVRQVNRRLKM
jgi:hypothetical protein